MEIFHRCKNNGTVSRLYPVRKEFKVVSPGYYFSQNGVSLSEVIDVMRVGGNSDVTWTCPKCGEEVTSRDDFLFSCDNCGKVHHLFSEEDTNVSEARLKARNVRWLVCKNCVESIKDDDTMKDVLGGVDTAPAKIIIFKREE